ncbi:hypothetical protein BYT27DRAFT_7246022 [Phlegmacium glaucopus]|nr:hypothetical protein BYT27DRAFT_7246022 [Phlegmacium glaucopus]
MKFSVLSLTAILALFSHALATPSPQPASRAQAVIFRTCNAQLDFVAVPLSPQAVLKAASWEFALDMFLNMGQYEYHFQMNLGQRHKALLTPKLGLVHLESKVALQCLEGKKRKPSWMRSWHITALESLPENQFLCDHQITKDERGKLGVICKISATEESE